MIEVTAATAMFEVFDLPASLAFYRDVLGFELISGDDSWWCRLKLGKVTLMLNTAYEPGDRPVAADPQRIRGHADASLYLSSAEPHRIYAHIASKGWFATEPALTSYGMWQVTTTDPDGFKVVFISPGSIDESETNR